MCWNRAAAASIPTQHPPTSDQGDVPSSKAVVEPMASTCNIQSALEWDMEKFEFKCIFEWCRSLASLNAPKDLLHQQVEVRWYVLSKSLSMYLDSFVEVILM